MLFANAIPKSSTVAEKSNISNQPREMGGVGGLRGFEMFDLSAIILDFVFTLVINISFL